MVLRSLSEANLSVRRFCGLLQRKFWLSRLFCRTDTTAAKVVAAPETGVRVIGWVHGCALVKTTVVSVPKGYVRNVRGYYAFC